MQMHRSFWTFSRYVLGVFGAVKIAGYLWQGWYQGRWWTVGYMCSLTIPIIAVALFIWFVFVPRNLELSEDRLTIQFPFRAPRELSWNDLRYWGSGADGILLLQFKGWATYQLFLFALPIGPTPISGRFYRSPVPRTQGATVARNAGLPVVARRPPSSVPDEAVAALH